MENLNRLIEKYASDERIKLLGSKWESSVNAPPSRIQLKSWSGSQLCFILAGVYKSNPSPHLFIAMDKEEAAYIQNTLTSIFDKKPVWFFPDSFKHPAYFEELNTNFALQRTETINRITTSTSKGEIVITYPEALFEKVVAPDVLSQTRLDIIKDQTLDIDFIIEVLITYGFERSDFVISPGQFSIRGGIIDIFSYGNAEPYRVELNDDVVESIRTFDPSTQLSTLHIAKVAIVPNINTKFSKEQKTSIFNVLPKNTVVWVSDFNVLIDKLEHCSELAQQVASRISSIENPELIEIFKDNAFIFPAEVIDDLEQHHLVSLGSTFQPLKFSQKIDFNSKPQPSFNKHFNLLIENLKDNENLRIENYIFTDNANQIERFYAIFEDLNADVQFHPITKSIHEGFIDYDLNVACYTDHQIFERFHRYRLRNGFSPDVSLTTKMLRELQPGDFVTHIDHGIGRFSGLERININGQMQESVRLVYKNNDLLYVSINSLHKITKYSAKEGTEPKLSKLGSDAWANLKRKTKRQIKDIAEELIKLYASRRASKGFAFSPDSYLQTELEASFIYEDTPDQLTTTQDVKSDMEKEYPMDRLICGDVGFGKTEVAIRAAFKAITDGKQVAILVPTTILALQHYKTFTERLKEFNVKIDYINRFKTASQKKLIFERLKSGDLELVIGTHGLLSKELVFNDLGLLIIDEEQKFGVTAKEKLRHLKVNVDTLTLTATPIPRTLQFSLMSARDLSVIRTPPPNRQPIHTEIRVFSDELIKDAIYKEINRGGQVFVVHNRVQSLPEVAALISELCPDVDVGIAHGQMDAEHLENALLDFIERRYEVLVSTNIIETGLDIPNANTIIINNAHQFGMSDLHQLRGRVGRSNRKAYCYLFCPPLSVLTTDARKRLKTIEEFSDLGSGIHIAMRDLDIRGAGNLLGGEQSGFITEIGFETYQKILEEAIIELKETTFKEVFNENLDKEQNFVREVQIEVDVEMLIPNEYVENSQERLSLYTELD
nr:transcription-repair coupling factor [Saprospiraceae bacterium]